MLGINWRTVGSRAVFNLGGRSKVGFRGLGMELGSNMVEDDNLSVGH